MRNYKNPEMHKHTPKTTVNEYPKNVIIDQNVFAEGIKNIRVDKSGYLEIVPKSKRL